MTDTKVTEAQLLQIIYSLNIYLGTNISVKEKKMVWRKVYDLIGPRLKEMADNDMDSFLKICSEDIFDSLFE